MLSWFGTRHAKHRHEQISTNNISAVSAGQNCTCSNTMTKILRFTLGTAVRVCRCREISFLGDRVAHDQSTKLVFKPSLGRAATQSIQVARYSRAMRARSSRHPTRLLYWARTEIYFTNEH